MVVYVHNSKQKKCRPDIDPVELWTDIRAGDAQALTTLFGRFYLPLYTYGCKIVGRPAPVKDAIQELFCTLWNKRGHISQARSVRSYLFHSMRRILLRNQARQQNRKDRGRVYTELYREPVCNVEELILHFEADQEKKEQLSKAIASLSLRQREAVFLKFYEGLTNSEIAGVMGIGRQSVYNHVSEAIARLQVFIMYPHKR